MAARPQLPGMRYFLWMRIVSLRTGILTGIYLSCVFVAWLEVANRVAKLERFAELRNFVAGLTAWTVLTMTYIAAEMHFTLLESRMGALHVFVLGAVSYGFVAVLDWVLLMCALVRHQHMAQSRESAVPAGRHHTH